VTVALVVAHEKVLAMAWASPVGVGCVNLVPILERLLDREEGRVGVDFVLYAMVLEEIEDLLNFLWISAHSLQLIQTKIAKKSPSDREVRRNIAIIAECSTGIS